MSKYYYKKYETRKVFDTSAASAYYSSYWSYSSSMTSWEEEDSSRMFYIGTPSGYTYYSTTSMTQMLKDYIAITEDGYTAPKGTNLVAGLTLAANSYIIVVSNTLTTYQAAYAYLQMVASETTLTGTSMQISTYDRISARHNTLTDGAGTYIGEVIAEDGTYPDEGKGDDGYWYVKDRLAVEFKARIDGAWVTTEPYVRVGGVWVKADVHPRVNGAWVG